MGVRRWRWCMYFHGINPGFGLRFAGLLPPQVRTPRVGIPNTVARAGAGTEAQQAVREQEWSDLRPRDSELERQLCAKGVLRLWISDIVCEEDTPSHRACKLRGLDFPPRMGIFQSQPGKRCPSDGGPLFLIAESILPPFSSGRPTDFGGGLRIRPFSRGRASNPPRPPAPGRLPTLERGAGSTSLVSEQTSPRPRAASDWFRGGFASRGRRMPGAQAHGMGPWVDVDAARVSPTARDE